MSDQPERFVTPAQAHQFWVKHAYEILAETASRYNAVITYGDLAEEVQRRSGLWTKSTVGHWVGALLADITKVNKVRGEPALSALVVHKQDGRVGPGYDEVLRVTGRVPSGDEQERETHAAAERLECYRTWAQDVPEDAVPTFVTPAGSAGRSGSTSASRSVTGRSTTPRPRATPRVPRVEERRGAVCPTCFMEMPLSGRCTNCEG